MDIQTIKTPSLILDVARVRRNARAISSLAHNNSVRLRPHIKTHKCVEVARLQTAGHDGAITVSTLEEARAFAAHGFLDITYAVPIEQGKFAEAVALVRGGVKLGVITDDAETSNKLDEAAGQAGVRFDVFLKVDCGYHRCGVEPHTAEATAIPRQLSDAKNLEFAGILTHAGHSYNARSKAEINDIARQERDVMAAFGDELRAGGIEVPTVSIGSTPSITHVDHLQGVDEIRPGNYIFFDAFQATLGSCATEDCALTVLAAVVHRDRSRKKIIVDAGAIAISKDRGAVDIDSGCGYGGVLDLEGNPLGAHIESLSQEHGVFHLDDDAAFDRLTVGSRVRILANHSCLTAAQHEHYNVLENDKIVDRWEIYRGW